MYFFSIAPLLVLTFARLSYSITFKPFIGNDTSTAVVFNWTRNTTEPAFWALAPIFTFNTAAPPVFEFQFVHNSNETSGHLAVPVQTSANLTLLTFSYQFQAKEGHFLEVNLFGSPTTFQVTQSNGSPMQINPGFVPRPLQSMLTQAQHTTIKTPMIVGIVVGSVVFLLLLLVAVLLYRRRRARNRAALLRMEHQQYRTMPPAFASFPRSSAASDGSRPWSVTSAQALPAHAAISPALSFRAGKATVLREDVISKSPNLVSLPTYPGNSLAPRRFLSLSAISSNSKIASERQRDVERAIQQLQGKAMKLQAQNDRNTAEGIEDEVEIVHVKLEIERLKRVLDSEWALGMTDEIPAGLHCL